MTKTTYKTVNEFLLGDIFVYEIEKKRTHFHIEKIQEQNDGGYEMIAKLLWVSDGNYFGYDLGYMEIFSFGAKWLAHRYEVKKTSRYGCCEKCFAELHWVTMALKCSQCGIVY